MSINNISFLGEKENYLPATHSYLDLQTSPFYWLFVCFEVLRPSQPNGVM